MMLSEKTDAGETLPTTRCKDKIMITGASSLSANTVQLLFGTNNAANATQTEEKLFQVLNVRRLATL